MRLSDDQFKYLLSHLLNVNITTVTQQFTVRSAEENEEVKTELLDSWTNEGDSLIDELALTALKCYMYRVD